MVIFLEIDALLSLSCGVEGRKCSVLFDRTIVFELSSEIDKNEKCRFHICSWEDLVARDTLTPFVYNNRIHCECVPLLLLNNS